MASKFDRIDKEILIQASPARIWRALTDPAEFGAWFGARLEGRFAPGQRIAAQITTPGYEHLTFEIFIEVVEPEKLLSYRWRPHTMEARSDYSEDPTTLVEFRLQVEGDATRLHITESGLDALPPDQVEEVFRRDEKGWEEQILNIERHVSAS